MSFRSLLRFLLFLIGVPLVSVSVLICLFVSFDTILGSSELQTTLSRSPPDHDQLLVHPLNMHLLPSCVPRSLEIETVGVLTWVPRCSFLREIPNDNVERCVG